MKAAFSVWKDRIAPVFDVARQIHVVHTEAGRITGEEDENLPNDDPAQKSLRLAELGVSTLICGAISRQLHSAIAAYGIHVIPFVAGDVREVIGAHLAGRLDRNEYAMPGYRRGKTKHPIGNGRTKKHSGSRGQ